MSFAFSKTPYILIPRESDHAAHGIKEASGIVGCFMPDGEVTVDYEGNIYRSSNIKTWADRIVQAAGRHVEQYPTVARMVLPASEFVAIGQVREERIMWPPLPKRLEPHGNDPAIRAHQRERRMLVPHFDNRALVGHGTLIERWLGGHPDQAELEPTGV